MLNDLERRSLDAGNPDPVASGRVAVAPGHFGKRRIARLKSSKPLPLYRRRKVTQ